MSVIPTIQTPIYSQDTINSAQAQRMGIHIAIAALIQNQVDHILRLRKPHLARFLDWKHEDHRGKRRSLEYKEALLQQHPGLLSGPQAMDLQGDDWTPVYVLSASIPPAHLEGTAFGTDLQVCNIIWQFKTSKGPLALTLYTNHIDPTPSSSVHRITTGHLSSHNLSRLLVGQKGVRVIHAGHYLMEALRKEPMPAASNESDTQKAFGMALRVGHTVGEFHWQSGSETGHPDRLILKEEDLTPYSLRNLELRPEFTFPYDTDANRTLGPKMKTRIQAIYWRRFQYKMSEKEGGETAVTEPEQERTLAKADEVVTIRGLSGMLTPEYLFSGIYTIFPPRREWSISFPSCAPPVVSFFIPDSGDSTRARRNSPAGDTIQEQLPPPAGQFYFRDRLIATNPAGFSRVGINYFGRLDASDSGFDVQVTGESFKEFIQHLSGAIGWGIRWLPELAVELVIDILTETSAVPDDCGPTPHDTYDSHEVQSTEVKRAFQTAFEAAWRRLDPKLAEHQGGVYPYVTSLVTAEEDKALIQDLGMHPIPVHPRVRLLLTKSGAYPLVKDHAESLLLSAVGAAHLPAGVDILKAALPKLLPDADLAADPLSVRQYTHSYPRVVWDPDTRVFVMASSLGAHRCTAHKDVTGLQSAAGEPQASEKQPVSQCLCWIGLALQAAASSWQTKHGGRRSRPGFDEEFFHVLLDCYQTAVPALRTMGLAPGPEGGARGEQEPPNPEEEDDVLSYFGDTPAQSEDTTPQATESPRPSGKATVAKSTPPPASSGGSNTVPYPSPASSPPLPRRQVFTRAWAAQQQGSTQSNLAAVGSGAQKPSENREPEKGAQDMTDLFRIWDKAAQGVVGIAQASKLRMLEWEKESAAVREELAEEQARRAALDAAFATYKLESEAGLAAKDTTLAANAEAMKRKDAQISQLEESVSTLTARVQEQAAIVERQTALSQDQTERIQELKEREIRWTAHMKEMLAELRESSSPGVRNGAAYDEEEAGGPRKRLKLS